MSKKVQFRKPSFRKCRSLSALLLTLALLLAQTSTIFAQADASSATLKGTVTDPQGAVIAGATVSARSVERGTTRLAQTNSDGVYQILSLQPGSYQLRIEAQGFETGVINSFTLSVGQIAVYDAQLKVGSITNVVEITTEAPVIEVERTQQANTIETRQITNLPNIGRDFTSYVFTLPGVASSDAPRVQGGGRFTFGTSGFSIGGSNGRSNLVTVDGGENEYGSGQLRFALSPESVQEFQVNRNSFAAEFGFTAGTAVNVITKSGGNQFHGSAYVFYRSDKTSARNAFDFRDQKAYEQQVYPGFALGGPIKKNKVFFFTNYERQQLDLARFKSFTTNAFLQPNALQETLLRRFETAASANTQRIGRELRNRLTTTRATFPVTFNMLDENTGTFTAGARLNSWVTKVDYQATARDSISGRFSMARNYTDQLGAGIFESNSAATDLTYRDYTILGSWTHNFENNVVNQLRVQVSPNNSAITAPRDLNSTSLLVVGVGNFGRPFLTPFNTFQDRYQIEDHLTWIKDTHTFKFGGSYRPVNYRVINALWFGGEWNFSSGVFPLILGVPAADQAAFVGALCAFNNVSPCNATTALASINGTQMNSLQSFNNNLPFLYRQGFNNPEWQDRATYFGAFAQDSWKLHPRLTIDYGLRVDYDGEPKPIATRTYVSPRFGFAWDITGDARTVVRGGSGIFYSPIYYQISYLVNILNDSGNFINQVFRSPAFPATQTPAAIWAAGRAAGKLPFEAINADDLAALGISTAPRSTGRVVFELDPDYEATYSLQANLAIQRRLGETMSLEVAYQMYRGVHIQMPHARNYFEALPGDPRLAGRNPALGPLYVIDPARGSDPTITQFTSYASIGNSIYHGMTASLSKRFRDHISFQTSYTFSKTIDDTTDFNSAFYAPFPTRLNLDRGLSSFDIRHNFVFSGVLQSPLRYGDGFWSSAFADITFSPVVTLRSGIPFSLLTGADINGDTRPGNDRLFAIGRNTGIGPDFQRVDLRLTKAFRLQTDKATRLEFTVEGINLFNRTNYAAVQDILGANPAAPDYNTGTFRLKGRRDRDFRRGEPLAFTSAFDPRRIQFGLRFAF